VNGLLPAAAHGHRPEHPFTAAGLAAEARVGMVGLPYDADVRRRRTTPTYDADVQLRRSWGRAMSRSVRIRSPGGRPQYP
jgi:hypothetical protein